MTRYQRPGTLAPVTLLLMMAAFVGGCSADSASLPDRLDILHYDIILQPDIATGSVTGSVSMEYRLPAHQDSIRLAAGNLSIDGVEGPHVVGFRKVSDLLIINLAADHPGSGSLGIGYSGRPARGMIFDPGRSTVFTSYHTGSWVPSNQDPADKATFTLDVALPEGQVCVGSGWGGRVETGQAGARCRWGMNIPVPAFTFGFAAGDFRAHEQVRGAVSLQGYSPSHSEDELGRVFQYTADMMTFFEEVSGIPYDLETYAQVLIGPSYQEAAGWSMLREEYGAMVLSDSTETNLISHELAHQWWGNRVTCDGWGHIWLTEGFATFLSAAYNERRFGRSEYLSDMASYERVYEDIKARGKDRSLVYDDWSQATRDDRNLVYFKGAFVLHRLRETMGEEAFWNGIRGYTQAHFDSVVTTPDFQKAMEASSGMDLEAFFNEWVYRAID